MRSALAAKTAQDMGLKPVAHMGGGFAAWRDAGGPVEKYRAEEAEGIDRTSSSARALVPRIPSVIHARTMDCRIISPAMTAMECKDSAHAITADDPLVSTDWLAAHLDDPKVKIIDASLQDAGRAAAAGRTIISPRIFRARCFSTSTRSPITSDPRPHMYPDAEQFARDVSALGISTGDTVVAYDSGGWVAAPRAWWMFLSFGHPNVKVLDGGLKKWLREGRPTHSGKVMPKPGKFQARLDPSYIRSQQQLVDNLDNACRATGRCAPARAFRGHASPSRGRACRSGHIPGSRNVPYAELFDAETGAMKPLEDLRQAFTGRRRRYGKTDRDDLRLRRLRAGSDAGALSARRARQCAL